MFLEFAKGDIKKQTHSRYYRAYVNYVKDSGFGKIPVRKIKKYHCDDFIRTLTNGTIVYSYVCQTSHTCRRSYVTNCLDNGMKLALVSKNVGHKNKSTTLNTYYKCKNDYEDNLAIQNEIFRIYDFDFRGEPVI